MTTDGSLNEKHDGGGRHDWAAEVGEKLFQWRDFTPIPLILLMLFAAEPGARSATFGLILIMAGELFRVYSVAFIGSVSRTRGTGTTGGDLITRGPFRYVRNPLYVGNFLITFGVAVFSGVIWLVLLAALAFAFQYYCIVKFEERLLVQKFGRAYEEYRETVPAWIPARLPQIEEIEWPDTFSPALKSERRTLGAIAVMIVALMFLA